MSDQLIHSGIILAAGKNTRFDTGIPKSLHKLNDITLLERHIRELHKIHCHTIAVVVGYRGEIIEDYIQALNESLIMPVDVIWNHDFEKANAYSILAAREWINEKQAELFYCTMSDHVYESNFYNVIHKTVKRINHLPSHKCNGPSILNLIVDKAGSHNAHIDIEDVTKVRLKFNSRFYSEIAEIGKHLDDYGHYDTGFFILKPEIFDKIPEAMDHIGDGISDTVTYLIGKQQACALDMTGLYWNDVDTPIDHKMVLSHISRL